MVLWYLTAFIHDYFTLVIELLLLYIINVVDLILNLFQQVIFIDDYYLV